jgi:rod shape-determining protein MreB
MVTKIGLDLGYANISISDASLEVYREPSVARIDKNTRRIVSVGREAVSSATADDILVRPFKNGLLYSVDFTSQIISAALKAVSKSDNVRCLVAVPSELNSKQESELAEIIGGEGISECFFVNRALSALVGAGYAPTVSAVSVNVGASATEIVTLHQGSIIYSSTVAVGGENFDEAVRAYIHDQGELNISLLDARAIKERIGAVWEGRGAEPITVEGTLALTGNKIKMTIGTEDILGVFEKPLHALMSAVADAVKRIPTEYVEKIFSGGIILSGGGAELYGLDKMIANVFGIGVTLSASASDAVARGLSIINSFLPIKMRGNGKNITSQIAKHYKSANKNKSD